MLSYTRVSTQYLQNLKHKKRRRDSKPIEDKNVCTYADNPEILNFDYRKPLTSMRLYFLTQKVSYAALFDLLKLLTFHMQEFGKEYADYIDRKNRYQAARDAEGEAPSSPNSYSGFSIMSDVSEPENSNFIRELLFQARTERLNSKKLKTEEKTKLDALITRLIIYYESRKYISRFMELICATHKIGMTGSIDEMRIGLRKESINEDDEEDLVARFAFVSDAESSTTTDSSNVDERSRSSTSTSEEIEGNAESSTTTDSSNVDERSGSSTSTNEEIERNVSDTDSDKSVVLGGGKRRFNDADDSVLEKKPKF